MSLVGSLPGKADMVTSDQPQPLEARMPVLAHDDVAVHQNPEGLRRRPTEARCKAARDPKPDTGCSAWGQTPIRAVPECARAARF